MPNEVKVTFHKDKSISIEVGESTLSFDSIDHLSDYGQMLANIENHYNGVAELEDIQEFTTVDERD